MGVSVCVCVWCGCVGGCGCGWVSGCACVYARVCLVSVAVLFFLSKDMQWSSLPSKFFTGGGSDMSRLVMFEVFHASQHIIGGSCESNANQLLPKPWMHTAHEITYKDFFARNFVYVTPGDTNNCTHRHVHIHTNTHTYTCVCHCDQSYKFVHMCVPL